MSGRARLFLYASATLPLAAGLWLWREQGPMVLLSGLVSFCM